MSGLNALYSKSYWNGDGPELPDPPDLLSDKQVACHVRNAMNSGDFNDCA